jgi:hypothetical protein
VGLERLVKVREGTRPGGVVEPVEHPARDPEDELLGAGPAPKYIGSSRPSRRTSVKPAPVSSPRTRSGSAIVNGPGRSAGGGGRSRPAARAPAMVAIHSFLGRACQTSRTSVPPGRSALAMFAKAAGGSPKNMAAVRLIATS